MSIRDKPLYISTEVWRALWLLAKADAIQTKRADPGADWMKTEYRSTPDEIADRMLRESLTQSYPQVLAHQKEIDKLEKELIKELNEKVSGSRVSN